MFRAACGCSELAMVMVCRAQVSLGGERSRATHTQGCNFVRFQREPLPKWVQPKLYLSDDKMVLDYANEVNRLGEERGCEAGIEVLERLAAQ